MATNWSHAGSVSRGEAVDRARLTAIEQVSPAPGQLRRIPEVAAAMSQVGECHRITGEDSSTSRCTCAPSTSCRGSSTRHRAPASTTGIEPGTRSLRLVLPVAMATSNVALSSETKGTRSQAARNESEFGFVNMPSKLDVAGSSPVSRSRPPSYSAPRRAPNERRIGSGHGDYDVSLLVSLVNVPVGFGDLFQRIASVDHGSDLLRLEKLHEMNQVLDARPWVPVVY